MKTISLENLETATEQEVFSFISTHLINQAKPCIKNLSCWYKYEGRSCSAGCLITDKQYDDLKMKDLEGESWEFVTNSLQITKNHYWLIAELQNIHDNQIASNWLKDLEFLAKKTGLELPLFFSPI